MSNEDYVVPHATICFCRYSKTHDANQAASHERCDIKTEFLVTTVPKTVETLNFVSQNFKTEETDDKKSYI